MRKKYGIIIAVVGLIFSLFMGGWGQIGNYSLLSKIAIIITMTKRV